MSDAWDTDHDAHREFVLAALRVASARCKLMDNEITAIGVALKGNLIGPEMAVKWAHDGGLMYLLEPMPGAVTAVALTGTNQFDDKGATK